VKPNLLLMKRLVIMVASAALLAGCASKGPVSTLYDFGPMQAGAVTATMPQMPLVVADVTGPAWLDSRTMYYRLLYADVQQSRPYADNRWNSTPLQLLNARLKSRIAEAGGKVLSVTDAAAGALLLRIEVDDFSQNFDSQQASSGHITLRASVFRARRLIDQKTFVHTTAAESADALGGARALAQASDAVAADIIGWLAALPLQKE
jgi:cholesterol transport system auxiliary component